MRIKFKQKSTRAVLGLMYIVLSLPILTSCNELVDVLLPPEESLPCTPTPPSIGVSAQTVGENYNPLLSFDYPHVPGRLLVYKRTPEANLSSIEKLGKIRLLSQENQNALIVEASSEEEAQKFAKTLVSTNQFIVQPDYIYYPLDAPNDPYYYQAPAGAIPLALAYTKIGIEGLWSNMPKNFLCTPLVAVLDSAFNVNHPDLKNSLTEGYNATPDGLGIRDLSPSPPPSGAVDTGESSHGQAVAGLIGATANNNEGIAGVGLNKVKILPIKVFYWERVSRWSNDYAYITTSSVLAGAIDYATQSGATVINMSLGSPTPLDPIVQTTIQQARNRGVVVVAAAGNLGDPELMYPARYPEVIAVGSVNTSEVKTSYSNYSTTQSNLFVTLGGDEGELIPSLSYNGYGSWAGTSFSAPQASGAIALYMGAYASLRKRTPPPDQVLNCLKATSSNKGRYEPETGYGLIQAMKFLEDSTCMR